MPADIAFLPRVVPRVPRVGVVASTLIGTFALSTIEEDAFRGALAIFRRPAPVALCALAWGITLGLELAQRESASKRAREARGGRATALR